jgi:AcrR family transcriptional regulator
MTQSAANRHCEVASAEDAESAKRRQIVEGAREVFLAHGFDAASMGEIARVAGVSKGTLYVYFDSKESLFEAIVEEQCRSQAEQVFTLQADDRGVRSVLTRMGREFVRFMCAPERLSSLRTVISIADRMPELGKRFYDMGPAFGMARVARYLQHQVDAGVLAVPDCELAAGQFLDSCLTTTFKPLLFNFSGPPDEARIAYVVETAVNSFMATYGTETADAADRGGPAEPGA